MLLLPIVLRVNSIFARSRWYGGARELVLCVDCCAVALVRVLVLVLVLLLVLGRLGGHAWCVRGAWAPRSF